jgi:hypothetical protein
MGPSKSLTWKLEQPSATGISDEDLGPAWFDPGLGTAPAADVAEGRWITRREAQVIASEHGLAFVADDGRQSDETPEAVTPGLDISAINRKLREAGISEAELRLEETPGFRDVLLWGSLVQSLPGRARKPDSPFTTAMVSMLPDELMEALDVLVPGWRSAPSSGAQDRG